MTRTILTTPSPVSYDAIRSGPFSTPHPRSTTHRRPSLSLSRSFCSLNRTSRFIFALTFAVCIELLVYTNKTQAMVNAAMGAIIVLELIFVMTYVCLLAISSFVQRV
ncbi:hypothetical protein QBC44DRAFT_317348, partial [Cladorrhinum sp. PSN332]